MLDAQWTKGLCLAGERWELGTSAIKDAILTMGSAMVDLLFQLGVILPLETCLFGFLDLPKTGWPDLVGLMTRAVCSSLGCEEEGREWDSVKDSFLVKDWCSRSENSSGDEGSEVKFITRIGG